MANDYDSPGKSSDELGDRDSEWPPLGRQKVNYNCTKNRPKDKENREVLPVNIAVKNKWEDRRSNLPPRLRNQKSGRKFGKKNYQNNNSIASISEGSTSPITLPTMLQRVPPFSSPLMPQPVSLIPTPLLSQRVPLIPPPPMLQLVTQIPPPTMSPRVPLIPPPMIPQQVPFIPLPRMPQQGSLILPPIMPQQVPFIPPPTMPQQVPFIPPPTMPQQVPFIPPPTMPQQVPLIPPPTMSQQMPFIPPQTMPWQIQPIPTLTNGQVPHPMVYLPPIPSQMMYVDRCTLMFDPHKGTSRSGSEINTCTTSTTSARPSRPFLELKDSTEKRKFHIMRQIQFYFRSKKMLSDSFFLQNMDAEGFVPISVIASFPKVKEQTKEISLIMEALKLSDILEVAGDKVRLKDVSKTSEQSSKGIENQAEPNADHPSPQLETFPPVPCNEQFCDQTDCFPNNYDYQNYVPVSKSNNIVYNPDTSCVINGVWYPPLIYRLNFSINPIQYGLTPSPLNFQTYPASVSNFNLPTNSNEQE